MKTRKPVIKEDKQPLKEKKQNQHGMRPEKQLHDSALSW